MYLMEFGDIDARLHGPIMTADKTANSRPTTACGLSAAQVQGVLRVEPVGEPSSGVA